MTTPLELDFVLVSNDYLTLTAVSGGVKKYGAKFVVVPSAEAARKCLERRKIDGVFVDLAVPGALGLIEAIRKGTSNSKTVIFACLQNAKESTATLNAGANFLLRNPVSADSVALHITIAKDLMLGERRRYFRHAVNLPVLLKDGGAELRARMTNVSEGGMAVRTSKPLKHKSVMEFAFALPLAANVSGKGQVAWTNTEAMAGIFFQTIHGKGLENLRAWITARERLSLDGLATETPP